MGYVGQFFKGDVDHAGNIGLPDAQYQSPPLRRYIRHNRTCELRGNGSSPHFSLKSDDARSSLDCRIGCHWRVASARRYTLATRQWHP